MKKLIPLVTALVLTFGAVTAFSAPTSNSKKATSAKSTKTKTKKATKS
ncbi:MAG TPA: hypothetical protein VMB03_04325 [Bryobacteraceae bacterium]|nr:hypothetical protein [Bryobacteraceae bacterium]